MIRSDRMSKSIAAASGNDSHRHAHDSRHGRSLSASAFSHVLCWASSIGLVVGVPEAFSNVHLRGAPQRLWCRIRYARIKEGTAYRACSWNPPSSRRKVGVVGGGLRHLGGLTGCRCLSLKMGEKQTTQSAGLAGMRARVRPASKSLLERPLM
jgi:hypothetical protein